MDSEMRSPLTVQGLCKNYPAFRLENVSFSLTPGTITGFIGRNGAGKTTTINSILSFIHPDAGEISFFGLEYPEHDREIKKGIGFVSAGMTYYTRKKLKEITGVTKTFYPDWDDGAYRKWLDSFGLDEEKTPAELSNGMKIKYALALALSHGAELLILDEPTSGLDPVSREELVDDSLKGKHMFGVVTVGDKGQIVIPVRARRMFKISPGSQLMVLGQEDMGLALMDARIFMGMMEGNGNGK